MNKESTRTSNLAFVVVATLFLAWGFVTSLIDPLVAAVKGIFSLSDVEAQLSASAYFIAYGLVSFPAAALVSRHKTSRSLVIALSIMIAGCLVTLAAANLAIYPLALFGLLILASGVTILQVAANPLVANLGSSELSHFRLTLSQAFNSFGTFIGPYVGATLFLNGLEVKHGNILTEAVRTDALAGIDRAFFWIGGLLAVLTLFVLGFRKLIAAHESESSRTNSIAATIREAFSSRWALVGGGAIFLYVGAEVAIGTQMALYLNSDEVLGLTLQDAGKMVSFYWGGAMVGRLIGTGLLARIAASRLLTASTAIACSLCLYIFTIGGVSGGYAALSIGLLNSIMFPVIFTLTLERSTASAEATSGILCFAIIGGAIIPPLTGLVAQHVGYSQAFAVPAICYALLCLFAVMACRTQVRQFAVERSQGVSH